MECPHCRKKINETLVLSEAGRVMQKKSTGSFDSERAKEAQRRSVEARKRNKTK